MKHTSLFLFLLPLVTSLALAFAFTSVAVSVAAFQSDFLVDNNGLTYFRDNTTTTFYVTLRQKNLNKLASIIHDVSDIDSPNYGNYLTKQEIDGLISPTQNNKDRVRDWLENNHVHSIT